MSFDHQGNVVMEDFGDENVVAPHDGSPEQLRPVDIPATPSQLPIDMLASPPISTTMNNTQAEVSALGEADNEVDIEGAHDPPPSWRPTAEEIEATRLFDETNTAATPENNGDPAQHAQFLLDLELAQTFQAMESGAAYAINLPWEDRDQPPETFSCICGDMLTHTIINKEEGVLLPCNHARCTPCLNDNIKFALESRKNFPPKCCGGASIDINDIARYLNDDVLVRWTEVQAEFSDVSPVYCAVPSCSAYLGTSTLIEHSQWAVCNKCHVKTCTGCLCLESAHLASDSPEPSCPERIDKRDKELMVKEGWKPCPSCSNMIEKIDGCDHMTCECGQDFCYAWQRPWADKDQFAQDAAAQEGFLRRLQLDRHFGAGRRVVEDADGHLHIEDIDDELDNEVHPEEEDNWVSTDQEEEDEELDYAVGTNADPLLAAMIGDTDVIDYGRPPPALPAPPPPPSPPSPPLPAADLVDPIQQFLNDLLISDPDTSDRMEVILSHTTQRFTLPGLAAVTRRIRAMDEEEFQVELERVQRAHATAVIEEGA